MSLKTDTTWSGNRRSEGVSAREPRGEEERPNRQADKITAKSGGNPRQVKLTRNQMRNIEVFKIKLLLIIKELHF